MRQTTKDNLTLFFTIVYATLLGVLFMLVFDTHWLVILFTSLGIPVSFVFMSFIFDFIDGIVKFFKNNKYYKEQEKEKREERRRILQELDHKLPFALGELMVDKVLALKAEEKIKQNLEKQIEWRLTEIKNLEDQIEHFEKMLEEK